MGLITRNLVFKVVRLGLTQVGLLSYARNFAMRKCGYNVLKWMANNSGADHFAQSDLHILIATFVVCMNTFSSFAHAVVQIFILNTVLLLKFLITLIGLNDNIKSLS